MGLKNGCYRPFLQTKNDKSHTTLVLRGCCVTTSRHKVGLFFQGLIPIRRWLSSNGKVTVVDLSSSVISCVVSNFSISMFSSMLVFLENSVIFLSDISAMYVCMYVCVYIYIHTYIHIPIIFKILSIFPLLICFPNMLLVLQNLFSNDVFHMWRFPKIRGTPSHQAGPTPWLNPPVFPSDFSMWLENAQETLYFQGNMVSFRFPTN